jgi:hypothetical protein
VLSAEEEASSLPAIFLKGQARMKDLRGEIQRTNRTMLCVRLRRVVLLVLTFDLALLLIAPLIISVALAQGLVAPPTMHLDLRRSHIHAYTTELVDCRPNQPYMFCTTQRRSPQQTFFVVWVRTPVDLRGDVGETNYRLFVLPLQYRFAWS